MRKEHMYTVNYEYLLIFRPAFLAVRFMLWLFLTCSGRSLATNLVREKDLL